MPLSTTGQHSVATENRKTHKQTHTELQTLRATYDVPYDAYDTGIYSKHYSNKSIELCAEIHISVNGLNGPFLFYSITLFYLFIYENAVTRL